MAEITTINWNGTTYYQVGGKGQKYMSYGQADRARRGLKVN